jgi:hypothetical protein
VRAIPTPDCDAENRKTLNNTAYNVANFRQGAATTTTQRQHTTTTRHDHYDDSGLMPGLFRR